MNSIKSLIAIVLCFIILCVLWAIGYDKELIDDDNEIIG
jgi:hypothetical protein